MDENTNKDENKEPKDQIKKDQDINELIRMIEDFKHDIQNLRQFAKEDTHLEGIKDDETYKLLLEKSDLTANDEELENLAYPYRKSRKQREEEESKRIRAQDLKPLHRENWKPSEQKVYIREFFEDQPEEEEPVIKQPIAKPAFSQRFNYDEILEQPKRDFEQLVGENILNRLGILLVTVGVGILLRYGINVGAVSELQRALIGYMTAVAFLGIAHQLRKRNETFSTVFIYGGVAIAYYTSYLSFNYYALVNQTSAFAIDIIITAVALFFAISYDRRRLALLALAGGYLTPFMVRTGEVNYMLFFAYILMVNIIMIAVANYKKWEFINYIVFLFSVLLFGGWLTISDLTHERMYTLAFLFATLFYVTFFMMCVMLMLRHGETSNFLFVMNTMLYYIAVWFTLAEIDSTMEYMGSFSFLLGAFNGLYAISLRKNPKVETEFINYLSGFAIFMVTLSVYIEFEVLQYNRYWVIESVALLLIGRMTGIKVVRDASAIIMLLATIMLVVTWYKIYTGALQPFFFNQAVYTSLMTVAGAILSILLLQKYRKVEGENVFFLEVRTYMNMLGVLVAIIIYLHGNIELHFHDFAIKEFRRLWVSIYNSCIVLLLWGIAYRLNAERLKNVCTYLSIFSIIVYFLYGHFSALELRDAYLLNQVPVSYFMLHYVNVIMDLALGYLIIRDIFMRYGENSAQFSYLIWFVSFIVVFHASAELDNLVVLSIYEPGDSISEILVNAHRIGYALLWAAASFGFMLLGMRWKLKDLRVISLSLFAVVLLKFLVFDFKDIGTFGKIISMIFLGSLMLVISFLYNQLRIMVNEGEIDTSFIRRPDRRTRGADPQKERTDEEE